jgi:WD40 repeat protein
MTFRKLKEIHGHSSGIYSLDFSENYLYSGSADHFVARWKVIEGVQDAFSIRFENPVYCIRLFDAHTKLAVGLANGDLHFFDLAERKEIKFLVQHKKAIFSIYENSILNHLYVADADGNVSVWDVKSNELMAYLPFDCGKIRRMSVSSNGGTLTLACQDGIVRILETNTLNLVNEFAAHKDGVTAILYSADDANVLFTAGKDAYLKKWDLHSGSCLKALPAHNFAIYDLILLQNPNVLISASRDKTIKIWNPETLEIIERLDFKTGGHRHSVNALISVNSNTFASASDDRRILVWSSDH